MKNAASFSLSEEANVMMGIVSPVDSGFLTRSPNSATGRRRWATCS